MRPSILSPHLHLTSRILILSLQACFSSPWVSTYSTVPNSRQYYPVIFHREEEVQPCPIHHTASGISQPAIHILNETRYITCPEDTAVHSSAIKYTHACMLHVTDHRLPMRQPPRVEPIGFKIPDASRCSCLVQQYSNHRHQQLHHIHSSETVPKGTNYITAQSSRGRRT